MSIDKLLLREFSKKDLRLFKKLNTPRKVQDYLDKLPFNFEREGETYRSPRKVLKQRMAHCFEGACFAAACLFVNGRRPLILDLKVSNLKEDADHVVSLFKENGLWGAISKTNHAVLSWRDPIYRSVRELVLSYFHEYFLDNGTKTLKSYSRPFDIVKKFGISWINTEDDLDQIAKVIDKSKHTNIHPKSQKKFIRNATKFQIKALALEEWDKHRL